MAAHMYSWSVRALLRNNSKCAHILWTQTTGNIHENVSFIRRHIASKSKAEQLQKLGKGNRFSTRQLTLFGFGVGAIVGVGYGYYQLQQMKKPVSNLGTGDYTLSQPPPKFKVSKRVTVPPDTSGLKLTLFQYQTCPFCCKVRAFLDYYGFSYDVIEVNPVLRQQVKWSSYKKVPTVVVELLDGKQLLQLNDSSVIISALASYLYNQEVGMANVVSGYPLVSLKDETGKITTEFMNKYSLLFGGIPPGRSKEDIVEEQKWRQWVDDVFVHMISPNVYRTWSEAVQAFHWFSEVGQWEQNFAAWERTLVIYVGAAAMYLIGKRLKKRHNLQDDVRQSLYAECNYWLTEVKKKGSSFLGGEKPNLADLALYGSLNSFVGCDAFRDLLENTSIEPWFERMKMAAKNHDGKSL